ncbi:CXD2 protein, partial [Glareola pratincola]|nr:CXD2 protein [Glareola pratincola]
RILLTVVVIFRILIVAIVGETVYDPPQTMFMCNTLQPPPHQACYDKAFPISPPRYWVFQIILVCPPSLCFITYSGTPPPSLSPFPPRPPPPTKRQEGISRFYPPQVVFRNALEIGSPPGQYFLYGFNVPAIFECHRYPCVKEVECYVSRPTEKTV